MFFARADLGVRKVLLITYVAHAVACFFLMLVYFFSVQLKSQETVSNVMKHYYCMLKKDKADFKRELEAIVPEVKLGDKGVCVLFA